MAKNTSALKETFGQFVRFNGVDEIAGK